MRPWRVGAKDNVTVVLIRYRENPDDTLNRSALAAPMF